MSVDLVERNTLPDRAAIAQSLAELREQRLGMEQFVEDLINELDAARAEIMEKACVADMQRKQLDDRQQHLNQQNIETQRISETLDHQDTQLVRVLSDLEQVKTEMDRVRAAAGDNQAGEGNGVLDEIQQVTRQRDELRERLDQTQSELVELASVAAQLAKARQELVDTRDELAKHREARHLENASLGSEENRRVAELEQERAALETELELVRRRSAELTKTLDDQQEQMARQQTEWSSELKQMRHLLESRSEAFFQQHGPADQPAPTAAANPRNVARNDQVEMEKNSPNVVESVKAQFAKLQKDVSKRRSRKNNK